MLAQARPPHSCGRLERQIMTMPTTANSSANETSTSVRNSVAGVIQTASSVAQAAMVIQGR